MGPMALEHCAVLGLFTAPRPLHEVVESRD